MSANLTPEQADSVREWLLSQRKQLEAACLEGLYFTEWGPRYSPADGAAAVLDVLTRPQEHA